MSEKVLKTRKTEHEHFEIVVKHVLDIDPDLSYLGEYTDTWTQGAIKRKNADSKHEYRYFVPAISAEETAKYWRENGDSKHEAWLKGQANAKAAFERMEAYDEWFMIGIVVEIHYNGEEIASASLWGIESDSDDSLFAETEKDVAADALRQAVDFLKKDTALALAEMESLLS